MLDILIGVGYIFMVVWLWDGNFFSWLLSVFIFSIPFGIVAMILRTVVVGFILSLFREK